MRQTGVVTHKGHVAIPDEMRRAMDLDEGDRVAFDLVDDEVRIRRVGSIAARTAGVLGGDESPETAERLREIAEEAIHVLPFDRHFDRIPGITRIEL